MLRRGLPAMGCNNSSGANIDDGLNIVKHYIGDVIIFGIMKKLGTTDNPKQSIVTTAI